jgi:hypothetical protein
MTEISKKVEDLLVKHPNLTQAEAIKIVADKNERKKAKKSKKQTLIAQKTPRNMTVAPDSDET